MTDDPTQQQDERPPAFVEPEQGLDESTLEALPTHDPDEPVDRADVIGAGARSLAAWCGRFLLFAAAIVVVGWVTGKLWGAILPIVLALLITSVLWPVVSWLKRKGVPYALGAVIALLWSGLARYMQENGYDYLIGCASVSMADGGHAAASLYNRLKDEHLCPLEYRVFPRTPLPLQALRQDIEADTPPLIKGYLRAGAWICGEPAWDPDFNTADLPVLLPVSRLDARYAKHFMGRKD